MVTREDLLTILCFGAHVAKVDGHFHELEKKLLGQLAELMKITTDEKKRIMNREETLFDLLDQMSSNKSKTFLTKTVCLMAFVDGIIVEVEQNFLDRLLEHLEEDFNVLPSHEWGSYNGEVRGAFLFYAK